MFVNFICDLYPKPIGVYTGHIDIDDKGNEDEGNKESFNGVLRQGNLGNINFEGGGWKIKLSLVFHLKTKSISFLMLASSSMSQMLVVDQLHCC